MEQGNTDIRGVHGMNVKEYLWQVGIIDARLKTIDANIKKIQYDLQAIGDISVSSKWPDGQPRGTKTTDPTGSKAVKLADATNKKRDELIRELRELEYRQIITRSHLWSVRMDVIDTIEKIYDPAEPITKTYYKLLMLRYIDNKTWEQIAVELGYTFRHTTRLHGIALKRMEKILNE